MSCYPWNQLRLYLQYYMGVFCLPGHTFTYSTCPPSLEHEKHAVFGAFFVFGLFLFIHRRKTRPHRRVLHLWMLHGLPSLPFHFEHETRAVVVAFVVFGTNYTSTPLLWTLRTCPIGHVFGVRIPPCYISTAHSIPIPKPPCKIPENVYPA